MSDPEAFTPTGIPIRRGVRVGWRVWGVRISPGDGPLLTSIWNRNIVWPPYEVFTAVCIPGFRSTVHTMAVPVHPDPEKDREPCSDVPEEEHKCGIYGYWSRAAIERYAQDVLSSPAVSPVLRVVIGRVTLYGSTVPHPETMLWRAELGYPEHLYVPRLALAEDAFVERLLPSKRSDRKIQELARALNENYGRPVEVIDWQPKRRPSLRQAVSQLIRPRGGASASS